MRTRPISLIRALTRTARRSVTATAAVLVVALAAVTVPQAASAAESPAPSGSTMAAQGSAADGRALARSLFFLTGPDVDAIPELVEARDAARAAGYEPDPVKEAAVLDAMQDLEPDVFASFSASMRSGDHVRVRDALTTTSDLLLTAAESALEVSGQTPTSKLYLGPAVVMAVVAVAWLVAGVSVVVGGMVAVAMSAPTRDSVPHDRTVSAIVRHLG